MKKAAIWIVVVAVLGGAGWYGLLIEQRGFPIDVREVRDAVARANYCSTRADCNVTPGDCPFSYEPVNVREMQKLNELYRRYFAWEHKCMTSEFDNRDFSRIACRSGKCVVPEKGQVLKEEAEPRKEEAAGERRKTVPLQSWQ